MTVEEKFKNSLHNECSIRSNDILLIAISGGMDSVVLTHLAKNSGYHLELMHCNFQLRGEESERDEAFVKMLASDLGLSLHVQRFQTKEKASELKKGMQETARLLRYEWFQLIRSKWLESHQRVFILTAHHQQDNIETVLMNFFRGTGIDGLRGILPISNSIVRPLLTATHEELKAYAQQHQLQWVEDSSNEDDKYLRNAIRHQLTPLLNNLFPGSQDNLAANIERFRDIADIYHERIAHYRKKLLLVEQNEARISVRALTNLKSKRSILFELIRPFNFHAAQLDDIIQLLQSDTGKYVESSTHRILKHRDWLIIGSINNDESNQIVISKPDTIDYPGGRVQMKTTGSISLSNDPLLAQFDSDLIEFPLILRKWKTGDYFYPLGMRKKKKIARFLIDQKLSRFQKENCWVIEMNKKIIWIVGHRIDDRFKVTNRTKNQLIITSSAKLSDPLPAVTK